MSKRAQILQHEVWATLPFIPDRPQLFTSKMLLVVDDPLNEYARAIRRISRQIGQVMVGLALGIEVGEG